MKTKQKKTKRIKKNCEKGAGCGKKTNIKTKK